MIKTGGENVASREVEEAIFRHPDVAEVAVFGVPHPKWIEAVVAEMWPETIHPSEIGSESLAGRVRDAREALLGVLSLDELL